MNRRFLIAIAVFGMLGCGVAYSATKVYRYRCPKCKLIQEYGVPGPKKCPNDGHTMIKVN